MKSNQNLKFNKIEMMGISKIFPGVQALDKVDFEIKGGTVHAIVVLKWCREVYPYLKYWRCL